MPAPRPGRPRASSRRSIEDAAGELFLEQGYAGTTVDDIARRAGVGRATFFNYYPSKADLLWVDVDEALDLLQHRLRELDAGGGIGTAVDALETVVAGFGPERIPLAVLQLDVMGGSGEVATAGYARAARLSAILQTALTDAVPELDRVVRAAAASALAGATVAAWYSWAAAGVSRGPLPPYLRQALEPIRAGLDATLG